VKLKDLPFAADARYLSRQFGFSVALIRRWDAQGMPSGAVSCRNRLPVISLKPVHTGITADPSNYRELSEITGLPSRKRHVTDQLSIVETIPAISGRGKERITEAIR
jgi:hypothetical protein